MYKSKYDGNLFLVTCPRLISEIHIEKVNNSIVLYINKMNTK